MLLKKTVKYLVIAKVLASSVVALAQQKITLTTEDNPPFNMEEGGKITGLSTDIMRSLLDKAKISYTISMYPWARAYKMGLEEKNTAVYSTTRTAEREALFKWVGPLVENSWVFYAKKGTKIKITSVNDAKKYVVGGYNGDAKAEFLIKEGFTVDKNLQLANNDRQNALKLDAGKIDLWASDSQIGPWIAKAEKIGEIVPLYTIKKTELHAAFNKDTDDATIKNLNSILDSMRKSGEVKNIYGKYK
ncbi:ABC transporter substrate-binding protein [Spirobacillus cienkowskii]|uniref:substrate-binding periplasmic protein n=1 Tax=Spirobacillus cienkowskii TaxID=495820 RepID=UPI0030D2C3C3